MDYEFTILSFFNFAKNLIIIKLNLNSVSSKI